MTFRTGWRLALAADLLCEPDATVGSVAKKVGYSSPFALSTAFKRVRGKPAKASRERHFVGISNHGHRHDRPRFTSIDVRGECLRMS